MDTHLDTSERTGASRRRPYLLTLTAAALSVGLLSLAGAFAQATDRATTGQNVYETGGLDEAPDVGLQLTMYDPGTSSCGTYQENLTTGIFDVTEGETPPTSGAQHARTMCIRNIGSEPGSLVISAIDLADRDIACTNREAEVDDTCGGDQMGELSSVLSTRIEQDDAQRTATLSGWREGLDVGTLDPGEEQVLTISIPETRILQDALARRSVQSDRVTWRFQFDLTQVIPGPCEAIDAEPNDTPETALTYVGPSMEGSICPGDSDWYELTFGEPGTSVNADITVRFNHALGDIDIQLFDEEGFVDSASSSDDDEEIVLEAVEGGTYLLRVFGFNGDRNDFYTVTAVSETLAP